MTSLNVDTSFVFPKSRHAFKKNVTACKQAHDDAVNNLFGTYDDLPDFILHTLELFLEGFHLPVDSRTHNCLFLSWGANGLKITLDERTILPGNVVLIEQIFFGRA